MKYEVIGLTFIGSGLVLLLTFFVGLVPMIPGQGSWSVIIFPIFFLVFLLGVLDIIFGLLILIKQKVYERVSVFFGVLSLIVGSLYIISWWYIFWWLILVLFISGTILLYLGSTKTWK